METEELNFIPNEAGNCHSDREAQKVQSAVQKWKTQENRRSCKSYRGMSYWETVSSCKSL